MADRIVQRRFLQVGGRRVHYFRSGTGPPAVLIHSSPANARLLAKEIARIAQDFTAFAFDTPGFGLSDPLPQGELSVADLADAMAETLVAIAMPRCPVFGTHTGAAIALELGLRHPDRVTGLVLDGVPAFTDAECEAYFGDYFRKLPLSDLGGHYAETWTRFRDQSIWFPWSERLPAQLNCYDLSPPHSTHLWTQMYFEAAETYEPAYRAASYYGDRAIAAAAALDIPAVYCAITSDMLYGHLARLPAMRPGQAIVDIGDSYARKRELIAQSFVRFGSDGRAPADRDAIGSSPAVARQFIDGSAGQLHLRFAGERSSPALLLLHDAPGSAEQAEPLIAALAERFFVLAPDLPGHGESDAFADAPDITGLAAAAAHMLDALGVARTIVYGIGFGSSVALGLAETRRDLVAGLALEGVLLPDAMERATLQADYAPPIEIAADGSHWYRAWLMLRDSQIYWPWFDRSVGALRRAPADFTARPLHRWTMDVMRARTSYGHMIAAALEHDADAALAGVKVPLVHVAAVRTPLGYYDDAISARRHDAATVDGALAGLADRLVIQFGRDHRGAAQR